MHKEALEKQREPAIWLRLDIGATPSLSKLGGLPSLPEYVEWPRQVRSGTPLHFLAQIDLAQLPSTPLTSDGPALPVSGMLYFFADLDEELLWDEEDEEGLSATRVIFTEGTGPERHPPEVFRTSSMQMGSTMADIIQGCGSIPAFHCSLT